MTDKKPATNVNISADEVAAAMSVLTAFLLLVGAVGNATGQATGHSASMTASDQQNKTDVNVPELITSLNGLHLQMASNFQASLNAINIASQNQAAFYEGLTREMALDHRDQNHTKQALAATFPFVVAGDAAEESANDIDK